MGSLKEQTLREEESHYIRLANALHISWEELLSLEYEITANMSKDGLIYGYVVSFDDKNDKDILGKIPGINADLSVNLPSWALERSAEDEYELNAITDNTDYESNFLNEIENLDQLFQIKIANKNVRRILLRQLFISIIGALETFLSDAFINRALSSDCYLENFVRNHPEFKKQKISISEIFDTSKSIQEKAKTIMVGTIYHKLPVVKEMYEQTFEIKFPDISKMQKYITQRHDLVHRNGKTTDGEVVNINSMTIMELKGTAIIFVNSVSRAFDYDDDIPF